MEKVKEKGDRRLRVWHLLGAYAKLFYVRGRNYSCAPIEAEAPYLLVSNHVTNFDPFLVGLASLEQPISFVASEHIFRLGFVSKLLKKLVDPIPRSKAASGAGTVKSCLRRLRAGEAVGLFAEGDCTWDGVSAPVFPATGKLAKAAGVPLVTFRIEGGHLTSPRWAKTKRKGFMYGAPVRVYSPEELKSMTPEEVTEAISRDIFEDAWEKQRNTPVRFSGKRLAEGLERAFFVCPECGALSSLSAKGDIIRCSACGLEARLNEYGFLENCRFKTTREWDEWQKEALEKMLETGEAKDLSKPLCGKLTRLSEEEGERQKPERAELSLDLAGRALRINGAAVPFGDISDMSMVKTNRLLFFKEDGYFEFKCKDGALRPYLNLWQAARRLKEGKC